MPYALRHARNHSDKESPGQTVMDAFQVYDTRSKPGRLATSGHATARDPTRNAIRPVDLKRWRVRLRTRHAES